MMPNIFEDYHRDWISKRIDAQVFVWKFTTEIERISSVEAREQLEEFTA